MVNNQKKLPKEPKSLTKGLKSHMSDPKINSNANTLTLVSSYFNGFIVGILSVISAILTVGLIGYAIFLKMLPTDVLDKKAIEELFLPSIGDFCPENSERAVYLASLILFPITIFLFNKLFTKLFKNTSASIAWGNILSVLTTIFIILYSFIVVVADKSYYIEHDFFFDHTFAFLFIFAAICAILFFEKNPRYCDKPFMKVLKFFYYGIYIFITATIFFMSVFDIYGADKSLANHFGAFFNSVAQVYLGKTLLVDTYNQYGLYPHFLYFIFKIIGLSVLKFTTVMGLIELIFIACIFYFLRETIKSQIIRVCGFGAFFWVLTFLVKAVPGRDNGVYYQYFPLRIIFLSIFMVICLFYAKKERLSSKKALSLYYCSFVLASISILWNVETGLITFVSWMLFLFYDELSYSDKPKQILKNILLHATKGFTILFGTILLYFLYIKVRSGQFPRFDLLFGSGQKFYLYGFFMIRMKLFHPWNLVVIPYIIGFYRASNAFITKKITAKIKLIFMLSIAGSGHFIYYQGRSHDEVMVGVTCSAMILLFMYSDELMERFTHFMNSFKDSSNNISKFKTFYICGAVISIYILFISSSFLISIFSNYGHFYNVCISNISTCLNKTPNYISSGAELIKAYTQPKEKVLIMATNSGIYYTESNTVYPIMGPSEPEMMLKSEIKDIENYLESPECTRCFLENSFFSNNYERKQNIINILTTKFKAKVKSPDKNMYLLVKNKS